MRIANEIRNPRGRNSRDGWAFSSFGGGVGFAFAEVDDPDFGGCLEIEVTPDVVGNSALVTLYRNGTDWLPIPHHATLSARYLVKVSGQEPVFRPTFAYGTTAVFIDSSAPLITKTLAESEPRELEVFDTAPRNRFFAIASLAFEFFALDPFTIRLKPQVMVNPWGDVPAYCDGEEPDCEWEGTPDASRSTGTAKRTRPAIFGFNDLTYSDLDDPYTVPAEDQGVPPPENLRINRQLGASAIRSWDGEVTGETPYDHALRREWFEQMREDGVRFVPIVYDAEATEHLVTEWGDIIAGVEVWNEPNFQASFGPLSASSPADYTDVLAGNWNAVKSVDPEMPVLGGCLARVRTTSLPDRMSLTEFLDGMYVAGAGEFMDAVSIHPYLFDPQSGQAKTPLTSHGTYGGLGLWGNIQAARDVMAVHSDPKPIWVTEVGYWPVMGDRTDIVGRQVEITQARVLALTVGALSRQEDVEGIFIHNLWESGVGDGVIRHPTQTLKPAAGVLAA